jgi:16S rRNA U516 pseudouridylate synthase RsuA-like enzyme
MAPKAKPPAADAPQTAEKGERIAKVLSRRGIASRREAERLIEAGEVPVNGRVITSPALNVTAPGPDHRLGPSAARTRNRRGSGCITSPRAW